MRVAIVGGGIAGLACASKLHARGWAVEVFDKGRGFGGRTSTRRRPRQFDHGAQYFTARSPGFSAVVNDWVERKVVAAWRGRFVSVDASGRRRAAPVQARYVGTPTMSALCRDLGQALPVTHGCRVTAVRAGDGGLTIATGDGDRSGFDRVVIAVPAPQALTLLTENPDLRERVLDADMAPCWAAMASFSRTVEVGFDGARLDGDGPLSWLARDNSKPGRPEDEAWVGHAGPAWSLKHLEAAAGDVARSLGEAIYRIVGVRPDRVEVHRWRYALVTRALDRPCLYDDRIGICGDYMLGPRVELAYESGQAMARTLLRDA